MTKERFDPNKTHANIGKMGHFPHGKTTLTAAIAKVLEENFRMSRNKTEESILKEKIGDEIREIHKEG